MESKKIIVRSQFDPVDIIASPSGNGKEPKYAYVVENGKKVRKVVGEVNLYEKIQASKDSCDIYQILERSAHGEANLLNVPNYGFVDLTGMPLTEDERIAMVQKAKSDFDNLSPEVKAAFGDSFANFYRAVEENKIAEALAKVKKTEVSVEENKIESEVVNNE